MSALANYLLKRTATSSCDKLQFFAVVIALLRR